LSATLGTNLTVRSSVMGKSWSTTPASLFNRESPIVIGVITSPLSQVPDWYTQLRVTVRKTT